MQLETRHENDILIVTVINPRIDAQAADDFKNFRLEDKFDVFILFDICMRV